MLYFIAPKPVIIQRHCFRIELSKQVLDSSLLLSCPSSSWGLLCFSFQHLHFHLCACFFPLEDINGLIDVGMWFTYHFFQPWLLSFYMVVGAWPLEVEVVPLWRLNCPFSFIIIYACLLHFCRSLCWFDLKTYELISSKFELISRKLISWELISRELISRDDPVWVAR